MLDDAGQFPALAGAFALGAVHVEGQAEHDQFGAVGGGGLADFGGNLPHDFFGDLGRDGRGQHFARITDGQPRAAVAVIDC